MLDIVQIPVLNDNYVYLVHETESSKTAVIDPAVVGPILDALEEHGWPLDYVLNTHHHGDHVGGNIELQKKTGCQIVGCRSDNRRIPGIQIQIDEGDRFMLGEAEARIFAVSGHTLGHIAYWFHQHDALFCGDTLFSMGCGILFEGSPAQMAESLKKIRQLPGSTRIYCAHEYTQANGNFALTIEPGNLDLLERMEEVRWRRQQDLSTVPSTLTEECATNPFLRLDSPDLRRTLAIDSADPVEVFAEIRRRKDRFS